MPHPLQQRMAVLRRRLRRLVLLYGLGWITAAVVGAIGVLGLADYLIRFQDPGIRILCSAAVLGALAWTGYRFLYLGLTVRLRDVDLARRLKRRFPQLGDRLVSAVEFLDQSEDDPLAGSAALRRTVISQAEAESEAVDFSSVLNYRPSLRAVILAASVGLLAAILVILDPDSSQIAVARLANPLGDIPWPRRNHLEVRPPLVKRVARGQSFEVAVIDRHGAKLPSQVRIHYRFEDADGILKDETELMRLVGDAMTARRENVQRPFSYWAEGGDDTFMRPIPVEVVLPPRIEQLSIRLIPPAYTGFPKRETEKNIRALVGTRIEIAARTAEPVRSAVLCLDGTRRVDGRVSDDGHRFVVPAPGDPPLLVERSGSYWFELTDRHGLSTTTEPRWEIRAVGDKRPTIAINEPAEVVYATPQAVVPLHITAEDDLAIRQITLNVSMAEEAAESIGWTRELYSGPNVIAPRPGAELLASPQSRQIEHLCNLAGRALQPGMQLDLQATVSDYRQQTGESPSRRLIVITPEELQRRIAGRHGRIRDELARVLKMQSESRRHVATLQSRLKENGTLGRLDVDRLRAAELSQRQVERALAGRDEGLRRNILAVLADLKNNRLDSPDTQRRMESLLQEADRLGREHLPIISREMTAAGKAGQQSQSPDPTVAASLKETGQHQDQVIAALQGMLEQLSQWDRYRRFHREISDLLQDQEALRERTRELAPRTLTKQLGDLSPQDRRDLEALARRQLTLARRLDRTEQGMQQAAEKLEAHDPLAADTLREALQLARQKALSGRMRRLGERLATNRISQAVAEQGQVVDDLREVLAVLENRRQQELARLARRLQQAAAELAGLERDQERLCEEFDQLDPVQQENELQRLGLKQEQLREDAAAVARRLKQLMADRAAEATGRAGSEMGQATRCAEANDQPGAAVAAGNAREALREAVEQLTRQQQQTQHGLAAERLAALEDALKDLRQRQQRVLQGTEQFDRLQQAEARLTRAQNAQLQRLANEERALKTDTGRLAEPLVEVESLHLALSKTAEEMGQSAELISQRRLGTDTQQLQQEIIAELDRLIQQARTSLAQSAANKKASQGTRPNDTGQPKPGGGQATPSAVGTSTDAPPDMARMQEVMRRLWGRLPPRDRQQMIQSPPEEFLPKYQRQTEAYFRRLSEQETDPWPNN